ncbi:hypothetical protein PG999_002242 [Apiospora kogelbergensis]|uniref:Box C/D snoRNA protein 1 n=1 Tax=Apiospora kogelbergensis TaxID=1337665 RepID=A0AAW0R7K2_9PEZI
MDPLLTSLCGICHVREPKYKCPRCGANTCSLACVKKHKKWSSCNGQRDATVYVPPAKLRTDAGIDHDYNFLTKIERSLEQTEKLLIHERGILPERVQQTERSNGPPNKKTRLNKGQSRGRTTLEGDTRSWARAALKKLNALDITVKHQPYGMSRHKNNTTSFNRRSQTINWQPEKMLNKTLDNEAMYLGYSDCREYHRRSQMSKKEKDEEKRQEKKDNEDTTAGAGETDEGGNGNAIFSGQDWESTAWAAAAITGQKTSSYWFTSAPQGNPKKRSERQRRAEKAKDDYQFYFHVPGTPSREPQKLIPIKADDTLASVLAGLEVLEFPTIFVIPAGMRLPPGYRLAKRITSSTPQRDSRLPQKRKAEGLVEYDTSEEEGQVAEADGDGGDGSGTRRRHHQ